LGSRSLFGLSTRNTPKHILLLGHLLGTMTGARFVSVFFLLFAPAAQATQAVNMKSRLTRSESRMSTANVMASGHLLSSGSDSNASQHLATKSLNVASAVQHFSRRLRNLNHQQASETDTLHKRYVPGSDGTYSQNYQDNWIAAVAKHNGWDKPGGFFLDLGAFNGLKCSNSALVEKKFGWKGVCVEARPVEGAFSERKCLLVQRALSKESGEEVTFYGTPGTQLQHINKQGIDRPDDKGQVIKTLNVPDLLGCVNSTDANPGTAHEKCKGVPGNMKIPSFIHFISMDIEGQGLNVLKTFPFDKVKVGAWVVEGEDSEQNNKDADTILKNNGYIKVSVENPGVDKYFIQPQFWEESLVKKAWRVHPKDAEC